MTLSHRLSVIIALLTLVCGAFSPACRASAKAPRVLIINSYHAGYAWGDQETSGILDALHLPADQVYIQYLDWKRFPSAENERRFADMLEYKFANMQLDAVITTDDAALDVALKYRGRIFPNLPIIFTGVNAHKASDFADTPNITGIIEALDPKGTLEVALKLHPTASRVHVITDFTESGVGSRKSIEAVAGQFSSRVKFNYLPDMSLEQLKTIVSAIPKDDIILIGAYVRDQNGVVSDVEKVTSMLRGVASAPIYHLYELGLGSGAVGGSMISARVMGQSTGKMALRVLRGESASSIPIIDSESTRLAFDYRELRRFGIPTEMLPAGSEVINRPDNLYTRYKGLIWTVIGSFVILLLIILMQAVNSIQRRRAAAQLRASERKFSSIFHHSPEAILITNVKDGRIIDANQSFERVMGYSREDFLGRSVPSLNIWVNPEERKEFLDSLIAEDDPQTIEVAYRRRSTETFVGLCSSQRIDIGGEECFLSIIIDIDERARMERELMAEKELLAVTLRSIGDAVITTDHAGRVVFVNPVAETLTGWTQADAAGKPLSEVFNIVHEITLQQCEDPVEKVLRTRRIIELSNHTMLIAKDDSRYIIADSGAPILTREGEIIGVVLVFRDITTAQRLSEEMQTSDKLNSLGVLAGGIAHDFNNLLAGILGNLSLARQRAMDQALAERLADAERATLRARDLTQQLLTFARGGVPVKQVTSLSDILQDTIIFALAGSQARAEVSMPDDLWPADIDSGQISQVVQNLVINADQAMPGGGVIRVRMDNLQIDEWTSGIGEPGPYVRVVVEDEGVGIPEETLPKIFDPYFTTKDGGTGLGLATAYSILKNHGGKITVETKLNIGSCFTIYLPALPGATPDAPLETCSWPARVGKVLVMDDDAMVRQVCAEMLESLGHTAEISAEGAEALRLYQQASEAGAPFDLVIADVTVTGGMGGVELQKHLSALDPAAKIVVTSGYSNDPVLADFASYGFRGVLPKPYSIDTLRNLTESLLHEEEVDAV